MAFRHREEKGEPAPFLWELWLTESMLLLVSSRNIVGTSQNAGGSLPVHWRPLASHSSGPNKCLNLEFNTVPSGTQSVLNKYPLNVCALKQMKKIPQWLGMFETPSPALFTLAN